MASLSLIKHNYSDHLNPMTEFLSTYIARTRNLESLKLVEKSVDDFCFNNTLSFKQEFYHKSGLNFTANLRSKENEVELSKDYKDFLNKIVSFDGECVFLLRDTYKIFIDYKRLTNTGSGIQVNRNFLCGGDEEKYFELVGMTYSCLLASDEITDFDLIYEQSFRKLIEKNNFYFDKAKRIYDFIFDRYQGKKIVWIDFGFQFTFLLFCYHSMKFFSSDRIQQDYYAYTTYVWLQDFFKSKYFSTNTHNCLPYEIDGIHMYEQHKKNRTIGAYLGFAIGDALGAPLAGMEESDVRKYINFPISGFTSCKEHPYFKTLEAGNYTDNTNLLLITSDWANQKNNFDFGEYAEKLVKWKTHRVTDRWLGITASQAIDRLASGISYHESGSKETQSCSALYRVIPMAIMLGSNNQWEDERTLDFIAKITQITHNSKISISGSIILYKIIAQILWGVDAHSAVSLSIKDSNKYKIEKKLLTLVKDVLEQYVILDDSMARKRYGTGSLIYQTLPLSIYYFLKYKHEFKNGVLAAANSIRSDSAEQKAKIINNNWTWEEEFLYVNGGNSDGIAALTGTLLGLYNGFNAIPTSLKEEIENKSILIKSASSLFDSSN